MLTQPFLFLSILFAVAILAGLVWGLIRPKTTTGPRVEQFENPLEKLEVRVSTTRSGNSLDVLCEFFIDQAMLDAQQRRIRPTDSPKVVTLDSDSHSAAVTITSRFHGIVPQSASAEVEIFNKQIDKRVFHSQRELWTAPVR